MLGLTKNLFVGITPPLITLPLSWSIYCGVYSSTKNLMGNRCPVSLNDNTPILKYSTIFACGAISGIIPSLIQCPTDLIKCYAQKYHLSSTEAATQIFAKFVHKKSDLIITSQPKIETSMNILLRKGILLYNL